MTDPNGVTQTILATDPDRLGNCLPACVATFLGVPLDQVPHFIEVGALWVTGDHTRSQDDRHIWFALLVGFAAGHGYWVTTLDSLGEAMPGEVVFVAGPSPRGVAHQVLYRDGALWWDPHPSRAGLLSIDSIEAWRPATFAHIPTQP